MASIKQAFDTKKIKLKKFKNSRKLNKKVVIKKDMVPDGLYDKCDECGAAFNMQEVIDNLLVCPNCDRHVRINAVNRIAMVADPGTFREKGLGYKSLNPLGIEGYENKLEQNKEKADIDEAFVFGYCEIEAEPCVVGVMDSYFLMGSMGSVVGEKVTRSFEYAQLKKLPLILFTASGGARMQEGIYSLMQMAKTSAQAANFDRTGGLYISVLTHPTTGGVTASFAMLGDIILAEPNALIGFAGPRVIEQTIKQKLPEGFQKSEFLQEKGFVDKVVHRKDMRVTLAKILKMHRSGE